MLVTVKNQKLYEAWIEYLMREENKEVSTPQIRTEAFFQSEAGNKVPLSH